MIRQRQPIRAWSIRSQNGYILVTVLVLLVAMMAAGLAFGKQAIGRKTRAVHALERTQTQHVALGTLDLAVQRITMDKTPWDGPGDLWYAPVAYSSDSFTIEMAITDEQSRLNINRLIQPSGHINGPLMKTMIRLFPEQEKLESRWKDAVHNWSDKHGHSPLPIDAARHILGITPHEMEFLTDAGNGRINLNTASPELLNALGGTEFQRIIINRRQHSALESEFSLNDQTSLYKGILPVVDVSTSWFRASITVHGKFVTAHLDALLYRSSDGAFPVHQRIWWS